jgi:hypothetical protein
MKRYIILFVSLLCINNTLFAQDDRINFPVNGTIFQRDQNDEVVVRFGGQVKRSKTWYFSIKKCTDNSCNQSINADQRTITMGTATPEGGKLFFVNQSSGADLKLPKGFYRLTLFYRNAFNRKVPCDTKDFGVGDVYFIGGQSNAAGFGGSAMTGFGGTDYNATQNNDDCISTTGSTDFSPLVRVYSNKQHENNLSTTAPAFSNPQKNAKYGMPYNIVSFDTSPSNNTKITANSEFAIFKNGSSTNPDQNRVPMYPNGYNSWCWAPLGYKFATNNGTVNKFSGTPTIWFNAAASGTSMVDAKVPHPFVNDYNAWGRDYYSGATPPNTQSLATKFSNVIRNYSSALGAKPRFK